MNDLLRENGVPTLFGPQTRLHSSVERKSFYEHFHVRRVEILKEMLGRHIYSRALDIGAGAGLLATFKLRDTTGIDIRLAGGVTVRASAENLPFQEHAFDLVFAGEVLEHLLRPMQALRDWVRVLDSKGTMILSTPNGVLVSPSGGNPEHKAIYAPDDITQILGRLGMNIVARKAIFTGLVSGRRLFSIIPLSQLKVLLLRAPVPLRLSYDIFYKATKEN